MDELERCPWPGKDPLYIAYHDQEWGVPLHDDIKLYELLTLGGAQAGLSWLTILKKRENYRAAFNGFDPAKVAAYTDQDQERLLANPGIVRNRQKIASAIHNARAVLAIQQEIGSLDAYLWSYVDGRPIVNTWRTLDELPAATEVSAAMSAGLRSRGFKFVGPTICYAFMQAAGMVNDHLTSCFRYSELRQT